ncbi:unnamed protein product [Spirodela intermedia]|uniref:YTH domain-containing family protein n=1 Tax=Spirodela intermedia TaxID=51605 RepID=A0A7I8JFH0_SPIIN|nr:unnamed protein product [Spirodela intermedia]CAA6668283.1 unnamed protein product [Spirodela intermedia]
MNRDRYNRSDFRIEYKQAKFFMIKSFSEDDIHKSIKYNLDAAFCEVEARLDKGTKCPIFLLFSVNVWASGSQKDYEFLATRQVAWVLPVKWHIIKDIPNVLFSNILLENNDNKRVTASRDTQEVANFLTRLRLS